LYLKSLVIPHRKYYVCVTKTCRLIMLREAGLIVVYCENHKGKGKGKVQPRTGNEGPEEE
jgi:hypothetical protein